MTLFSKKVEFNGKRYQMAKKNDKTTTHKFIKTTYVDINKALVYALLKKL